MNVACDYETPMQMLTTEKYIASRTIWSWIISQGQNLTKALILDRKFINIFDLCIKNLWF